MHLTYPQTSPETPIQWIDLGFSWLLVSVVWGLIPLIVTLFFSFMIGISPDIISEFRVGGTVLALTLCGTQLIDDVKIPDNHLSKWKWLKNFSIIIITFGAIITALNVLHGANIPQIDINVELLNTSAIFIFLSSLVISFSAFLVRVAAASESYASSADFRRQELIKESEQKDEVDGIKL